MLKSPRLFPLLIFVVALSLRLWGITWALPDANRAFSFHPDESVVVAASLRVHPLLLLLDPGFYNYGSLSLLINGFFIHLGEWIGLVGPGIAPGVPSAGALLTARLVTAFLGAGMCLFLYDAGRRLYGVPAGIAAAGLYAVSPLAVQHGHFATVDVPATFFVAGSLYFAARCFTEADTDKRALLWCGLWAGLAAATKYNAGLVLLAGVAAWWAVGSRQSATSLAAGGRARSFAPLVGLIGMAALGFLLGCPGVLLNFPQFRHDFLFEANHARTGSGDIFVGTPSGFLYHPLFNLPWAVGSLTALAILAGVLYALYRRRPADAILAAFVLPYYLVIGLAEIKFARYLLPLLPPLLLWAGALIPTDAKQKAFYPINAILAVCGVFALFVSCAFNAVTMLPDTRDRAAAQLKQLRLNASVRTVGFPTGPWYYSPTLNPLLSAPVPAVAKDAAAQTSDADGGLRLTVANGEWNVAELSLDSPDAVALSEYEYADAERIAKPEAITYISQVIDAYRNQTAFANPIALFGISVTHLDERRGLPTQQLPHDMLYTNPTTIVFTKGNP